MPDLTLLLTYSQGTTPQWDGLRTPPGFLLRWFADPFLPFPTLGFDVYRAVLGYKSTVPPVTSHGNAPIQNSPAAVQWLLTAPGPGASWQKIAHLCLPVVDPAYPCDATPSGQTATQKALSRLPAGANATKYGQVYGSMAPTLVQVATGQALPPVPAEQSGGPHAPTLNANTGDLLQLAALDPHVAEMLGLMLVDNNFPQALSATDAAFYKVVARYLQPRHFTFSSRLGAAAGDLLLTEFAGTGMEVTGPSRLLATGALAAASSGQAFKITLPPGGRDLKAALQFKAAAAVQVLDASGQVHSHRTVAAGASVELGGPGCAGLTWTTRGAVQIGGLGWNLESDVSVIRGSFAFDPGQGPAPAWVAGTAQSIPGFTGREEVLVGWDLALPAAQSGAPQDGTAVFYQAFGAPVSTDPSTTPATPAPPSGNSPPLANGDLIVVPESAQSDQLVSPVPGGPAAPVYYVDRGSTGNGVAAGWRAYWVRAVDLFGRVTPFSPPGLVKIVDDGVPVTPRIVAAEYIQAPAAAAPAQPVSAVARRWLAANPAVDGLAVSIGWTPEMALNCAGVDGFSLFFRPSPVPSSPDPGWTAGPYTVLGPLPAPVPPTGAVQVAHPVTGATTIGLHVTAVTALGAPVPDVATTTAPPPRAVCVTDLHWDAGAGVLVGWQLVSSSGHRFAIVANGNGTNLSLTVQCPHGLPAPGIFHLVPGAAPSTGLIAMRTDLNPAPVDPADANRYRQAGVLVVADRAHATRIWSLLVVGNTGGLFYCKVAGSIFPDGNHALLPPAHAFVTWYPVYTVVVPGAPFGMAPSPVNPWTKGQVTACSIRRTGQADAVSSGYCSPANVQAIDATPPVPPTLHTIDTQPGDFCAVLAGPADWYGHSSFPAAPGGQGLSWTPVDKLSYNVCRASGAALWLLDLANSASHDPDAMAQAGVAQALKNSNPSRWSQLKADFTALDDALGSIMAGVSASTPPSNAQLFAAYESNLHADAQQVLAEQDWVVDAYVLLNGQPLSELPAGTTYTYADVLEGRSHAHWFYRVKTISATGIPGNFSAPTPPICCPRVVPPRAPVILTALSGDPNQGLGGTIILNLVGNSEADLQSYAIYQLSPAQMAGFDSRYAGAPALTLAPGTDVKPRVSNAVTLTAAPGQLWCFCTVAIDTAGNVSAPSAFVQARSLPPPPPPPVNLAIASANGSTVLTWSMPTLAGSDYSRMACQVERQAAGAMWTNLSGWLPRGATTYADSGANGAQTYLYRVRGKDLLGQVSVVAVFPQLAPSGVGP